MVIKKQIIYLIIIGVIIIIIGSLFFYQQKAINSLIKAVRTDQAGRFAIDQNQMPLPDNMTEYSDLQIKMKKDELKGNSFEAIGVIKKVEGGKAIFEGELPDLNGIKSEELMVLSPTSSLGKVRKFIKQFNLSFSENTKLPENKKISDLKEGMRAKVFSSEPIFDRSDIVVRMIYFPYSEIIEGNYEKGERFISGKIESLNDKLFSVREIKKDGISGRLIAVASNEKTVFKKRKFSKEIVDIPIEKSEFKVGDLVIILDNVPIKDRNSITGTQIILVEKNISKSSSSPEKK